jgi:hypothetical protein
MFAPLVDFCYIAWMGSSEADVCVLFRYHWPVTTVLQFIVPFISVSITEVYIQKMNQILCFHPISSYQSFFLGRFFFCLGGLPNQPNQLAWFS